MSQFLSPIHKKMYEKIHRQDDWGRVLCRRLGNDEMVADLDQQVGVVERGPIAEVIDLDNIHGWLSAQVILCERRFAATVAKLLAKGIEQDALGEVLKELGKAEPRPTFNNPGEVYQELMWLLLDGMPCDFATQLVSQDEVAAVFEVIQDVHAMPFLEFGLDPMIYHQLRQRFIEGWLSGSGFGIEKIDDQAYQIDHRD